MSNDNDIDWNLTTWEGSRRAQLRASLKLTSRQRFEALEEMAELSQWLAGKSVMRTSIIREIKADYSNGGNDDSSTKE